MEELFYCLTEKNSKIAQFKSSSQIAIIKKLYQINDINNNQQYLQDLILCCVRLLYDTWEAVRESRFWAVMFHLCAVLTGFQMLMDVSINQISLKKISKLEFGKRKCFLRRRCLPNIYTEHHIMTFRLRKGIACHCQGLSTKCGNVSSVP